jgi:hypothetical protein
MKDKILGWLFKGYSKRLQKFHEELSQAYIDAFKSNLDIRDLIRERLSGIKPNRPESGTILQNHLAGLDDAQRLVFLSKAKDVTDNPAFQVVAESLIVEWEHNAMLYAPDMAVVNFDRASINGIMLLEEEMQGLTSMFIEEQDRNKKMSEEERLSAL